MGTPMGIAVRSLALVLGALVTLEGAAAVPQPGRAPGAAAIRSLKPGRVLVSARGLPDQHFAETVILLVEYGRSGAMGLALNRPTTVPLTRVLPTLETDDGAARFAATATVFAGGPVQPELVLALSRTACSGCGSLIPDVYVVRTVGAVQEQIDTGADARRLRVFIGYSGWGPGQLESEMRTGAWHVLDGTARDVFDPQPETLWERVIARATAVLARGPGWYADRVAP